jgi:hypothetical protein
MAQYTSEADGPLTEEPITRHSPSPEERSWNDNKNPSPAVKVATASQRFKTRGSVLLLLASAVAPLAALLWWIVRTAQLRPSMLNGTIIGGRLSYIQAKAVDFVCSALLAPLLMVLLDRLWFSQARISAVNERQGHSLPLSSMVVASSTSVGGFDVLQIRALVQGKTWTLFLLALLVVLSGLSGKMLSNFIGYEAFSVDELGRQVATLRLMLDGPSVATGLTSSNYSTSQQSALANQITALLTGLNFENAVSKLDAGGGYIGANATAASMNALDSPIVGLTNVPGYRLSVDCQPGQPTQFDPLQMGETFWEISMLFNCKNNKTSPSCASIYTSEVPGIMSIGSETANNDEYSYIGFTGDDMYAYLGILDSFNLTQVAPSLYGVVLPSVFNLTQFGFQDTKTIMTTWGISCHIQRQEGLLSYSRPPGHSWTISESSFSPLKNVTKSYLGDWQVVLNYQAPIATLPGLGPALANTAGAVVGQTQPNFNWTVFALNYLYASGEAQRILSEVAATNASSDPSYFYTVGATVSVQHYRIIYIPILLLLGLLGVLGAAAVTSAMVFHTRNAYSTQTGRVVDSLRLLVDSAAGLASAAPVLADAAELNESDLQQWAEKFRVRYYETSEDGHISIRLARSGTTTV